MLRSLFLVGLLVLIPVGAQAQTAEELARAVARAGDGAAVERLVRSHRLAVKPAVQSLVNQAAGEGAQGADPSATVAAARLLADAFADAHGERSLAMLVDRLGAWTVQELAVKVEADSLLAAGIAIRSSDTGAAELLFGRAISLYERINDLQGQAEVAGQLGYVSWYLERERYIERNLRALELRRKAEDLELVGNTLNDLGLGHRAITRDYDAALQYYFEGEEIRRAIGDSARLAVMLSNIGRTYEAMGEYVKARDFFLDGAAFYLSQGDTANWIIQRRNTAGLMTNYAGRHTDALAILLELREDLQLTSDPRAEALVRLTLGVVRRRLGDYQGAVEEYQEVMRLSTANGYSELLSQALNNIGVVYVFMERPDRAVPLLERAYAADSSNVDDPPTQVLLSLSGAHFQLRDYAEAERWLSRGLALATERGHLATALKIRAGIDVRTGREVEAIERYDELLALADELETPHLKSDAYFGIAEARERLGDAESALSYYELAAGELEQERGMLSAEEDKAGFLAQTRYLYEEIVHFLTAQALENPGGHFAEKAFEFAERGKARAFLDQMAEAIAGVRSGVDPEFQADLDVLADNMAYLRGELATADPADREAIAELKAGIREMEGEYERVEREMLARNPRFAAIRYPAPVTVAELQDRVLGEGELLLQYALGDSSSTLWAVKRGEAAVYRLPTRTEVEAQVELLRFALENPSRSVDVAARRLFELLVAPVQDLVSEAREVIVVPDGALNYVPFEALVDARGQFLVHEAPISYAQSASVLRQLRAEPVVTPTMNLLAVGDPAFEGALETGFLRSEPLARLPFSGEEAAGIAGLFAEESTQLLLADAATQEAVIHALESQTFRYVHFATHGLVNDERPDYSGLALAGSGTDALLQASEIFNLRVNAELVVLSACETGLGQLVKGEGMVGLTRAFMYAGAPSVAVSLWSVSDRSTSALMQALYSRLGSEGISKAAALREAKLGLLKDPATAHPFHWAPFVLVGRSD